PAQQAAPGADPDGPGGADGLRNGPSVADSDDGDGDVDGDDQHGRVRGARGQRGGEQLSVDGGADGGQPDPGGAGRRGDHGELHAEADPWAVHPGVGPQG